MEGLPSSLQKLIRALMKLPSVGEKSATRLAFFLIGPGKEAAAALAKALVDVSQEIKFCEKCYHLSQGSLCGICANTTRDQSLLCVVEKSVDVLSIERTQEYKGYYHVLHGLWSPLKGVGPDSIKLKELTQRVSEGTVKEVILATGSTVEGDATALYISRALEPYGVTVTRLAQGMPKGGELEYADDITLSRALSGRNRI